VGKRREGMRREEKVSYSSKILIRYYVILILIGLLLSAAR
jgi:cytoskeletal protein RodZ